MYKNFERWIFYRFTRLSIRAKWAKRKLPELSKTQETIMKITLASIFDSDSDLLINPTIDYRVGEKYYIKKFDSNGDVEIFITISKTSMGYNVSLIGHDIIEQSRHDYHYDIWFNDECGLLIVDRFKRVLKRRRDKMEAEISKDDEGTLDLILQKLEKK